MVINECEGTKRKDSNQKMEEALSCGAGGIRTLVQTSNRIAFYMLSPCSIFDAQPTKDRLLYT